MCSCDLELLPVDEVVIALTAAEAGVIVIATFVLMYGVDGLLGVDDAFGLLK